MKFWLVSDTVIVIAGSVVCFAIDHTHIPSILFAGPMMGVAYWAGMIYSAANSKSKGDDTCSKKPSGGPG